MWSLRASSVLILITAALLLVTSFTSAGMMAPTRDTPALEAFELIYGVSADDLCGTEHVHDHHCPLCHGLPTAKLPRQASIVFLLTPSEAWAARDDLFRAAQGRNLNHSPRAPPGLA